MYVGFEKIPVGGHFPATKMFVVNYKKMSNPGPAPKNVLDLFTYVQKIMSCIITLMIQNLKTIRPHTQR